MKCLINCSCTNSKWVDRYFPNVHPYLLKFRNKPLLEYYLDFCELNKITQIRIVSDHKLNDIEEYFENNLRPDISISYSVSKPDDPIKNILMKNKKFVENDHLMIISDMIFIDYDIDNYDEVTIEEENILHSETLNGKLIFIHKKTKYSESRFKNNNISLLPVMSVYEYYQLCLGITKNKVSNLFNQGYNNEKNHFVGTNVEIHQDAEIEEDVVLGNNVSLSSGVEIGNYSIIGDNIIIDEYTKINNSIIYDDTYVGSTLTFEKKIVVKNLLIDPMTGQKFLLNDDTLATEISKDSNFHTIHKLFHKFFTIIIILLMVIPFFVLKVLCKMNKVNKEIFISKDKKVFNHTIYMPEKPTRFNSLFFKLSLDKFPLLFEVLKGNLYLIGNSVLEKNLKSRRFLRELKIYHPAIFTYNESLKTNGESINSNDDIMSSINDLFYSSNISLRLDLKIIVKCLKNSLI